MGICMHIHACVTPLAIEIVTEWKGLDGGVQEKLKSKPWVLEDGGKSAFTGQLEGGQTAPFYLLIMQKKAQEFIALPNAAWWGWGLGAGQVRLGLWAIPDF